MTGKFRMVVAGILCAGLLMLPAPVHAANNWGTEAQLHGGKLQACRKWIRSGTYRIKVRLNNRAARHAHVAAATIYSRNYSQLSNRQFRVRAGRISKVKYLTWRRGNRFSGIVGDVGFEGGGCCLSFWAINRC